MTNGIDEKKISNLRPYLGPPVTCKQEETVLGAVRLMQAKKSGSIVILDEEQKIKGIFTERDFLMKIAGHAMIDLSKRKIAEFMTPAPKTIRLDQSVRSGMLLMRAGGFRNLIVVDDKNSLQNVLSVREAFFFFMDNTK